jgi:purine-binding chemotaxis protein CheW
MKEAIRQSSEFVTVTVAKQLFGIPVLTVQDILGPQRITRIPLAPPEVAGALNLRGRIVTAIDVRSRLRLAPRTTGEGMAVVVEHDQELYSLIVDSVGDVLSLPEAKFEPNPSTLDALWREVSLGIYRLKNELLMVLDVDRLLSIDRAIAA